jgi:hypothetical protein
MRNMQDTDIIARMCSLHNEAAVDVVQSHKCDNGVVGFE